METYIVKYFTDEFGVKNVISERRNLKARTYFVKLMQDQGVLLQCITNFYGFHLSIELSSESSNEA